MSAGDAAILAWMHDHVEEHVDRRTDEVNLTTLAEAAADALGCDERLDDDTDTIWDLAIEAADARGER